MCDASSNPVDDYIAEHPPEIQALLQTLREAIRAAAPEATEKLAYAVPTFVLHGNLVHFAAAKKHIGFYPEPTAIEAFAEELADYATSIGSVRLPLNKPLPLDLIARMVRFRVEENVARAEGKKPSG